MSSNNLLGWLASGLVFAAFCAREMLILRLLAIASNFAFAGYGYAAHLWPIMSLHVAMLPINVARLIQVIAVQNKTQNRKETQRPARVNIYTRK